MQHAVMVIFPLQSEAVQTIPLPYFAALCKQGKLTQPWRTKFTDWQELPLALSWD